MDFSNYLQTVNQVLADPNPQANAILSFTTSVEIDIIQDSYGNTVVNNTTESVTLTAWLKQSKPPDNEVHDGLNQNREYFEGELVDPKTYELPLRPEGDILITINGRNGKFYPVELFDSPASLQYSIRIWIGQKIAGWIEFSEGN